MYRVLLVCVVVMEGGAVCRVQLEVAAVWGNPAPTHPSVLARPCPGSTGPVSFDHNQGVM